MVDPIVRRAWRDFLSQTRETRIEAIVLVASTVIGIINASIGQDPETWDRVVTGVQTGAMVLGAFTILLFRWNLISAPGRILADQTSAIDEVRQSLTGLTPPEFLSNADKSRIENLLIMCGVAAREALEPSEVNAAKAVDAIKGLDSQIGQIRHHEKLYGLANHFFLLSTGLMAARTQIRLHLLMNRKLWHLNYAQIHFASVAAFVAVGGRREVVARQLAFWLLCVRFPFPPRIRVVKTSLGSDVFPVRYG